MKGAFEAERIERAVRVQAQAYALLQWMERALVNGVIQPERGSSLASESEAALDWIQRHLQNFPPAARPEDSDLEAFSHYFTSFLDCSFDLEVDPGERLYSFEAHCFCPACSWMVRRNHLRPKKVRSQDKRKAKKLMENELRQIALDEGIELEPKKLKELLADNELRGELSLATYIVDVQYRMQGRRGSPASLALWRGFATDENGSSKANFKLTGELVRTAHSAVIRALRG